MVVKLRPDTILPRTSRREGLLYFDDGKRPLEEKVLAAARAYKRRKNLTGGWPLTCFVHPQLWDEQRQKQGCITQHPTIVGRCERQPGGFNFVEEDVIWLHPDRHIQTNNFFVCEDAE